MTVTTRATKGSALTQAELDANFTTLIESNTHAATSKATPVDADEMPLVDSAASYGLKKLTWANLKATLAAWINGGLIPAIFTTLGVNGASGTLGYSTGSGGTVTQATSKSTAVTLNKGSGNIVMNNAALAAGAVVTFQLTNSLLSPNDQLVMSVTWSTWVPWNYQVWVGVNSGGGSAAVQVKNISAGSLSEAIVITFAIVKGVAA
jgi:hypothetical protein